MNKLDTLVRRRVLPSALLPLVWKPSTNATDMMVVLDWIRNRWGSMTIDVGIQYHIYYPDKRIIRFTPGSGSGDTLMIAVCCAALSEVGVDPEDIREAVNNSSFS